MTGMLGRCTERSCPVRFSTGPDRPCPSHDESEMNAALAKLVAAGFSYNATAQAMRRQFDTDDDEGDETPPGDEA